ncbi:hypothetical protein LJR251_000304 [Rhizobium rhizogenes]|uniref:hypothetical protein n=1 Tax=Rhizobium rhizogenes TaxID=359 RepID=UPI003ED01C91
MATLTELDDKGALIWIDIDLESGEQPWRRIYGTPDFIKWLNDTLPNLTTTIVGGDSEPIEQVDAVFHEYIRGDHLSTDERFKRLSWTPDHSVWEFKTPDIRIFGWVPSIDVFICTYGDMKDEIEKLNKYGRYIAQTRYVRDHVGLNQPNVVESREYSDVLSDAP